MSELSIQPNKRLTFIGKTRSGKSFLAWTLLRLCTVSNPHRQVIFIDPKHEHKKFGDGSTLDAPKLVKKYEPKVRFQIFQEYTWNDELERMVDHLLLLKDNFAKTRGKSLYNSAIFVLDELGGIATATQVPSGINRLWTQGGGKDVGSWAMMQRTRNYPKIIKDQTEIFFMFRINSKEERQHMLDFIPDPRIVARKLDLHWFWMYSDDMEQAILCRPIVVSERNKPR